MTVFSKATVEDLHDAMRSALAEQQSEDLALAKAQLAVEREKNTQLERRIARLQTELKGSETATQFVKAFTAIVQPLIPEPVMVPVVQREVEPFES